MKSSVVNNTVLEGTVKSNTFFGNFQIHVWVQKHEKQPSLHLPLMTTTAITLKAHYCGNFTMSWVVSVSLMGFNSLWPCALKMQQKVTNARPHCDNAQKEMTRGARRGCGAEVVIHCNSSGRRHLAWVPTESVSPTIDHLRRNLLFLWKSHGLFGKKRTRIQLEALVWLVFCQLTLSELISQKYCMSWRLEKLLN